MMSDRPPAHARSLPELMTRAEYAKYRGVTWSAVDSKIKRGELFMVDKRHLNVADSDRRWPSINVIAQADAFGGPGRRGPRDPTRADDDAEDARKIAPHSIPRGTAKPRWIEAAKETATEAIGTLTPGVRLCGMTKGQFSLLDLIRAVIAQTGPAGLVVSTWTAGVRDAENAAFLLRAGELTSVRLLCDRSFPSRQPEYCARIVELFGAGSIVCTRTHAKFAVIQNDRWNITIRSSMNLNRNPRFEQFDLDDDPELAGFFISHLDEITDLMPTGFDFVTHEADTSLHLAMGGENAANDVYRPREPDAPDVVNVGGVDGETININVERALHERAKRLLAEHKLAEHAGEFVTTAEARQAFFERARATRDGILAVPESLSADLAAETDARKVHAMLTAALHAALE
jgi:hypothetical protein